MSNLSGNTVAIKRSGAPYWLAANPLILASNSRIRSRILSQLEIPYFVEAPDVDERQLEREYSMDPGNKKSLSEYLATAKVKSISIANPDSYILAADQTCTINGSLIHKPRTLEELKLQLQELRANTHKLTSSAVIAYKGQVVACCSADAELTMVNLTDKFIDLYLETNSADLLSTVGGYQIEGLGPLLFSDVKGDHYTIMGLPLGGVLMEFRDLGILLK